MKAERSLDRMAVKRRTEIKRKLSAHEVAELVYVEKVIYGKIQFCRLSRTFNTRTEGYNGADSRRATKDSSLFQTNCGRASSSDCGVGGQTPVVIDHH